MISAAIHESGHAVVSHALSCKVNFIEIRYSSERRRWEGSFGHRLPEPTDPLFGIVPLLKKGAKVARCLRHSRLGETRGHQCRQSAGSVRCRQ